MQDRACFDDQSVHRLAHRIVTEQMVLFVGAGASLSRFSTWKKLADELSSKCGVAAPTASEPQLLQSHFEMIKRDHANVYWSALVELLGQAVDSREALGWLASLPFARYVSINLDTKLETLLHQHFRATPRLSVPPVFQETHHSHLQLDEAINRSRPPHVGYPHGRIGREDTGDMLRGRNDLVLTESDYFQAYRNKLLEAYLTTLFVNWSTLFVGTR